MTRDEKGRFIKGNGGGPGRPARAVEEEYRSILVSSVSKADWEAIIKRAVLDAKKGDTSARKFLADYLIGPPVERKEIAGADGSALRIEVVYADDGNGE